MRENKPVFSDIKEELSKVKHLLDAFRPYANEEGDIGDKIKGFVNVKGKNSEMYKAKDSYCYALGLYNE